jgi:tetratricopeptide (TPR) repeat protein
MDPIEHAKNLQRQGNIAQAEKNYLEILQRDPNHLEANYLLAGLYMRLGKQEIALEYYKKTLKNQANPAIVHFAAALNLGNYYVDNKHWEQAIVCYQQAMQAAPERPETYLNMGSAYLNLKQLDDALRYTQKALSINPQSEIGHNNLGNIFLAYNQPAEAIPCYLLATKINPGYVEAHSNLCLAYQRLGKPQQAIESCAAVYALRPDEPETAFIEAWSLLIQEQYSLGWERYQLRWLRGSFQDDVRHFPQPRLLNLENLTGKKILLHSEQGLGDTIQFVRYATMLAALGTTVILEIQPELKTLLKSVSGVSDVVGRGEVLPTFDYYCPLVDLPKLFNTDANNIPSAPAYIFAPTERKQHWTTQLKPYEKIFKVGIVWAGNPKFAHDNSRSLSFELVKPILSTQGCQFFSLQKDVKALEEEALQSAKTIIDMRSSMSDFVETAAIISQLDLVITSCTAMAHLAGALGKPTWVLLAFAADWRWLLNRADSPWYPSVKLFRQSQLNQWSDVIAAVQQQLEFVIKQ